jgi:hypothetical protein
MAPIHAILVYDGTPMGKVLLIDFQTRVLFQRRHAPTAPM